MAGILKEDNNKFPNPRVTKSNFLSSIRDFEPDGVKCGIERVSKLFASSVEEGKAQMMIESAILQDMEKCRLLELDENGDYIEVVDEITGKTEKKMSIGSIKESDIELFPMFMACGKPKEISNDAELKFYPTSSAYPLFKFALINAGELPEDMGNKPFFTTQEELKDALEGLIFIAKCEEIKGKFNYMRMIVEPAEL